MTNPFEFPMPNPWIRDETNALYAVVTRDILEITKIRRLYRSAGGKAADLDAGQPPSGVWSDVIDLLAPVAGAMLMLCRRLMAECADLSDVCAAAKAMLNAKPLVEKRILPGNRIVLDRACLRQRLAEIASEEAEFKVLLVRGEPKSGKTFSRYLFERAAKERGAEVTFMDRDTIGSVDEVIRKLFGIFDARDRIPPVLEPGDAWYRTVCNELILVARNAASKRQLWIAVDDLGFQPDGATSLMDPEIRNFFNRFVMHLVDPMAYESFRLMLIDYPDAEPASWKTKVWEQDRTAIRDVCKDHVEEVIREWLSDRGEHLLDAEVDRIASDVIAFADAPSPGGSKPWLQLVHEELKRQLVAAQEGQP